MFGARDLAEQVDLLSRLNYMGQCTMSSCWITRNLQGGIDSEAARIHESGMELCTKSHDTGQPSARERP